ncbi:MAG: GNAT family N-acetyltransferase [Oscillospiraceae bacterium]|nr:GNAT family N-acetyltransferase [Oscillospiraceae bacterium]
MIVRRRSHRGARYLLTRMQAETMKHYPKPYDERGTMRWLNWSLDNYKKYGFGLWAIVRKDTGEFIGDCGITMQNIDGELLPEIGYHIDKKHWRQGFAHEAASAVRDWFFRNTDFLTVYSYMTASNTASYRTAASVGMSDVFGAWKSNRDKPRLVIASPCYADSRARAFAKTLREPSEEIADASRLIPQLRKHGLDGLQSDRLDGHAAACRRGNPITGIEKRGCHFGQPRSAAILTAPPA